MKRMQPVILIAVVIIAVALAYEWLGRPAAAPAPGAAPSVLVSTISLAPGQLPATLDAYGMLVAGPGAETAISLQAPGIVTMIPVAVGQAVAAGDTLAIIAADAQSIAETNRATDALTAATAARAHVAALLSAHLATNADLAAADQVLADARIALTALRATGAGRTQKLTAPTPGVVSAIAASPGMALAAGAPVVRLIANGDAVAVVGAPPAAAATVAIGDIARVSFLAAGGSLAARVARISSMLDPQTGLTLITLAFAQPPTEALNQPVRASITTGVLTGYVVPRDAVQNDEQGDYVFQIDGNIAHRVAVRVLGGEDGKTVIAAGPDPARPLVTAGAYQLDDGATVRTAP